MRRPFTTQAALTQGITRSAIEWAVYQNRLQRIEHGVYVMGCDPVLEIERAAASVVVTGGVAIGTLAAALHGLDSIDLCEPFVAVPNGSTRRSTRIASIPGAAIVDVRQYRCTDGLHTMLRLAPIVDDLRWEQALESALRKGLLTIADLERALQIRRPGNRRIRRVLALRPPGAPPTDSVLETHAVQLMRLCPVLPIPTRQFEVYSRRGAFVARVDLAFPEQGVFFELDGQWHEDQPVYDAVRQTRVTAATGWLVGRFTWDEIVFQPRSTLRRMEDLFEMARSISRTG